MDDIPLDPFGDEALARDVARLEANLRQRARIAALHAAVEVLESPDASPSAKSRMADTVLRASGALIEPKERVESEETLDAELVRLATEIRLKG